MQRSQQPVAPSGIDPAPACAFVIFGAHGDLTKRLLMPALYDLKGAGLLDDGFKIIGVDHTEDSDEGWAATLDEMMQAFTKNEAAEFYTPEIDQESWGWIRERLSYFRADFTDPKALAALKDQIGKSAVFYLAVPARFFGPAVEAIAAAGLAEEVDGGFRRVVVEKPFGTDLASARALNETVLKVLREDQVFRVDHFLGKETVQNILAMRFGNVLFEPIWNRSYIDNVQITASETVGVEGRAAFYEATGAFRDMLPNHLFQLLAMVAMEPPASFAAETVRNAKQQLFEAVKPVRPEDVARGQYGAGSVGEKQIKAYRESDGVASDSRTETYAAVKLEIENWRWAGVPFYLRTGKSLGARRTEIVIEFRRPPLTLFPEADAASDQPEPNRIILNVQPVQGVTLCFDAKKPGPEMVLSDVQARFRYADFFARQPNVGYETLIYDCLCGDATLFQRADNIDTAWSSVEPVLEAWAAEADSHKAEPLEVYPAGSAGPKSADELLARDGRAWYPFQRKD